jgi:hypothetical protein
VRRSGSFDAVHAIDYGQIETPPSCSLSRPGDNVLNGACQEQWIAA